MTTPDWDPSKLPRRQATYAVTIKCSEECGWSWTSPAWVKGQGVSLDDHLAFQAVRLTEELDKHFQAEHPERNVDKTTLRLPGLMADALRRRRRRG